MQTKESYFEAVRKKSSAEGFKEQKKLYEFVKTYPGLKAEHGPKDDVKNLSYVIKAGPYSVGYVQDDGLIQAYFLGYESTNTPLPEELREEYRRKTGEILGVKSKSEKWKNIVKPGTTLPLDKLKQLLVWIAQEIVKTK
jgi:hypothetical protein